MRRKSEQHPAQAQDSTAKQDMKREPDKGVAARRGKLGSLKKGDDAATRNARGMWGQQGGKNAMGKRTKDARKAHGK